MLLRFRVRNHRSIRDEEEISLVASSLKDNPDGLISTDAVKGHKLLPAVVVYGANAAGKSNFIDALGIMKSHVSLSYRKGDPEGGVPRSPFALNSLSGMETSAYEVDFTINNVRYNYGYETNDASFVSEWLYSYPNGARRLLFERDQQNMKFGRALKGNNRIAAEAMRTNSLFISTAAQLNHTEISAIVKFFSSLNEVNSALAETVLSANPDKRLADQRIVSFLNLVGTGICDIRINEQEKTEKDKEFTSGLHALLESYMDKKITDALITNDKRRFIEFAHRANDGEDVYLNVQSESDGTIRLSYMLGAIFSALDNGTPILIDELNAHLHTQACEAILALFCDPKTNPKGAQLIATTHDTNLLSADFLRRDQVWFAEKDREGATHFYPLTDIKTHKGDNIQKGYLQGRYGAVPFAGASSDLLRR